MSIFDQDNFLTKKPMAETKQPTKDKQEAYQAFIEHYNLSPLNNDAIMNCLFELNEKMNGVEALIMAMYIHLPEDQRNEIIDMKEKLDKNNWK